MALNSQRLLRVGAPFIVLVAIACWFVRIRVYEIAIPSILIVLGAGAYFATGSGIKYILNRKSLPRWFQAGRIGFFVLATLWGVAAPLYVAVAAPRGAYVPLYKCAYNSSFAPVRPQQVMTCLSSREHFCLLDGTKGTGKSEVGIHIAHQLILEGKVAIVVEVHEQERPLEALERELGVTASMCHWLFAMWQWGWKEPPTIIFDVVTKSSDFNAAIFRAEVKGLVADKRKFRALIIASDGLLFGTLTDEPRLTTFKASELPIDAANEFLKVLAPNHFSENSTTQSLWSVMPRTLQKLITVAETVTTHGKKWSDIVDEYKNGAAHFPQVMNNVKAAFGECAKKKQLLKLAVDQKSLSWSDLREYCGNVYDSHTKFNELVVENSNLFYPTGAYSWAVQFDVVREAMKQL